MSSLCAHIGDPMRMLALIVFAGALCTRMDAQSYDELFREAAALSAQNNYEGAIEKFKAALRGPAWRDGSSE